MLTLGSTKKSCVAQKTVMSTEKIFHIEVNVAPQNYVSHKENMLWQQKKLRDTQKKKSLFSVAQNRNTCLQKMVPVAYKYMLNRLKKFCVARKIL